MDDEHLRSDELAAEVRPKRRRPLVLVVVLVVAAAAIAFSFLRSERTTDAPTGTNEPTVVTEFRGDGTLVTDPFDVDEGWQIHWATEGERFAFAITGDTDYGTVIEKKGPETGVTSPVGAGTFRLEIEAKGPWSVRIVQGEPPAD